MRSSTQIVLIALACFAGCVVVSLTGCSPEQQVYPPAPFAAVNDSFPEVLPRDEVPSSEQEEAYDAYWDTRQEAFENSLEATILADGSDDEKSLFVAIDDERYAKARTLAEKILREEPLNIVALYAIANVEAFAEGDLAYGLGAIRQARQIAEQMGRENPQDPIGQEWYLRCLDIEHTLLSLLDRNEEVLLAAERIESVYGPVPWLKGWALVKLERESEARAVIDQCMQMGTYQAFAMNALNALEDKLQRGQNSLEVAREMCQRFPDSAVMHNNLGLAATYNYQFDEAERAFLASADATDQDFEGTPYIPLSGLLMQQGRFAEALDALKLAQEARGGRESYTLQQDEANLNLAIASLMLVCNESELAIRFAERANRTPDRAGTTSNAQRDLTVTGEIIYAIAQKYQQKAIQDQLVNGATETLAAFAEQSNLTASRWNNQQKLLSQLGRDELIELLRPYLSGTPGIETQLQSWHRFELLDLVPAGVLEVAIEQAKRVEDRDWAMAHLDALHAAMAYRRGDASESLRLAERALEKLPEQGEKVFRACTSAIAGAAAWDTGDHSRAKGSWVTTLRDFPQAFRLLDLTLPLSITVDEQLAVDGDMVGALLGSDQFVRDTRGFQVNVRNFDRDQLLVEMFRDHGSRHLEWLVDTEAKLSAEAVAAGFHDRFFQPIVELTQADLGSLDGSPVAARFNKDVDGLFSDFIASEDEQESE